VAILDIGVDKVLVPFVRQAEIYGWLAVQWAVAGTPYSGQRHEDRLITARTPAVMRGRWVRVRALPGRAERRVLHAEADSAAEALIFPPDGGQARASGRNRPNVPRSDIADVGSAEFNVCLWRRQSTVLLSQQDRSICSWWPAPLAVAEGASATDPADRPERRCEAISSAARRTWRISSS
jgi:hypothetical protein